MTTRRFDNPDQALSAKEVAEMLSCSEPHARELMKNGKIKSFKVGKRNRRAQLREVLRFMAEGGVREPLSDLPAAE